jgi:MFS family permease
MTWKYFNQFATHDISDFPGVLIPLEDEGTTPAKETLRAPQAGLNSDNTSESSQSEAKSNRRTLDSIKEEIFGDRTFSDPLHTTSYDIKAKVLNMAIQDIGMGRYQWKLFALCGCGWLADNLWLQAVALTLPSLSAEFGVNSKKIRYTTMSLFIGLCIGASCWGIASDIIGRRLAFNFTLLIAGVFGLVAAGASNWIGVCALFACLGLGIGGNLPVDGALFLEFLPSKRRGLLTLLSVWWPVGQLIASLIAWAFIPTYGCSASLQSCVLTGGVQPCCSKENNWGWRYFILTMGSLTLVMFIARFFLFHLFESPKFLLSRGRQAEAVAVIHGLAYKNKAQTWLTEDILNKIGGHPEATSDDKPSVVEIIKRSLSKFSGQRIRPLFHGRSLAMTTALLWLIWVSCVVRIV